ncbi:synaptonemal complex central element protein 3 [Austrofundulus limnaeus]|uniref:Synaptonemal complex central element protein 3 n=1 Tax=Austrofundulus limnaeus TaxID=52670 RepID=A0A2I4CHY9_AUSLI|nr:PREDICTED: synaptonemal complex central element protein 3 [Austrofundulus limnaeus]
MVEPSSTKLPPSSSDDALELNTDHLERMIETVENTAVELTCMAYDVVTLRTSPEVGAAMRQLEDAFVRCRAAVCGGADLQAELGSRPAQPAATTLD